MPLIKTFIFTANWSHVHPELCATRGYTHNYCNLQVDCTVHFKLVFRKSLRGRVQVCSLIIHELFLYQFYKAANSNYEKTLNFCHSALNNDQFLD